MLIDQGTVVMNKVRDLFSTGHKSSNKLYHVQTDGTLERDLASRFTATQLQKFAKRNTDAVKSNSYRTPLVPSRYDDALAILKLPAGHHSGNCDEMSTMSAYYAHHDHSVAKNELFIAEVGKPADHVFCLVTDGTPISQPKFASITDFTTDPAAKEWLVIDPWLHVCCRGRDYLTKGGDQLEKWGGAGKRIGWTHPNKGPGWYPPHGDYKARFAEGSIDLVGFFVKRY